MCLAAASAWADSTRIRRTLVGGATIFVESFKDAEKVSLQVIASARGTEDSAETHGARHLLEHLAALGRTGQVDALLEGEGLYLTAATNLETMRFEVSCRRSQVPLAIRALDDILSGLRVSEDDIKREARLIKEELALVSDRRNRFREITEMALGSPAWDPLGTPELIARVTPDALKKLHQTHFCQANLTVVVSGAVSLTEGETWADQIAKLAPASPALPLEWRARPIAQTARMLNDNAWTFAMPYRELTAPDSIARIAQAFGLATLAGGEVSFSPARDHGLAMIDVPNDDTYRWALAQNADAITWYGLRAMRRWFNAEAADPTRSGTLRGRLIAAQPFLTPEKVLEAIADLKAPTKARAWEEWQRLCRS